MPDITLRANAFPQKVVSLDAARRARERRKPQGKLHTKAEVAEHFRVSERTIGRWMTAGLPYVKLFEGGSVRFRIADCDEWFSREDGR